MSRSITVPFGLRDRVWLKLERSVGLVSALSIHEASSNQYKVIRLKPDGTFEHDWHMEWNLEAAPDADLPFPDPFTTTTVET